MDPPDGEIFKRSLYAQRDIMNLQMFDREELVSQRLDAPCYELANISKTEKIHIDCAFKLLRVLERAHSTINSYRQSKHVQSIPKCYVPFDVGQHMWPLYTRSRDKSSNPFNLVVDDVQCDDIPCFLPKLEGVDLDALNKALETHMSWASGMPDVPVFVCRNWEFADYGRVDLVEEDLDENFLPIIHADENALLNVVYMKKLLNASAFNALVEAVEFDRKDDFLKLISLAKSEDVKLIAQSYMMLHDSVNCFAAVLDGETGDFLTLADLVLEDEEVSGLHLLSEAAFHQSVRIAALLIEKGFANDANFVADTTDLLSNSPLKIALASLRESCMFNWIGESAVELVIRLCECELRRDLEMVRLLASKTKEVQIEFIKYLREGKMFEVGALMLAAHKHLFPFSVLGNLVRSISWTGDTPEYKEGLPFVLFDIFGKVGDKLEAYVQLKGESELKRRQVVLEVATILQGAGITVRHKELYLRPAISNWCTGFERNVLLKRDANQNVEEFWRVGNLVNCARSLDL